MILCEFVYNLISENILHDSFFNQDSRRVFHLSTFLPEFLKRIERVWILKW